MIAPEHACAHTHTHTHTKHISSSIANLTAQLVLYQNKIKWTKHQRATVANSRETNKQPQLQKQAQYFFGWFIIINIIYDQLFITNKWACNILNWNHCFIWKAKTKAILQKSANCNKSGNKPHLQSPVSRIGLEIWKRRKTQELQRGAVTWPHIYSLKYIGVILWKGQFFCP